MVDVFDAGWDPSRARACLCGGAAGGVPSGGWTAAGSVPNEGGAAPDGWMEAAACGAAAGGGRPTFECPGPADLRLIGGLCVAGPEVRLPAGILRCVPVPLERFPGAAACASSLGAAAVFAAPPPDGYEKWRRLSRARDADFAELHACGERSIAVLLAPRPGTADVLPIKRAVTASRSVVFLLDGFVGRSRREWLPPARLGRFDNVFVRSCGAPGPGAIRWFVGELGAGKLLFASAKARGLRGRSARGRSAPAGPARPPEGIEMLMRRCPFLSPEDLALILGGNGRTLWPGAAPRIPTA